MTSASSSQLSAVRISQLAAQVLSWGLAPVVALVFGILASLPVVSSVTWLHLVCECEQPILFITKPDVEFNLSIGGSHFLPCNSGGPFRFTRDCLEDFNLFVAYFDVDSHFCFSHLFDPHESSVVLGSENAIGQTLAQSGVQHATEATSIIGGPLIVPEGLGTYIPDSS